MGDKKAETAPSQQDRRVRITEHVTIVNDIGPNLLRAKLEIARIENEARHEIARIHAGVRDIKPPKPPANPPPDGYPLVVFAACAVMLVLGAAAVIVVFGGG